MKVDKNRVALQFGKSIGSYEKRAEVQRKGAASLVQMLLKQGIKKHGRVLEIGCGPGLLTSEFTKTLECDTLYLNDLVPQFETIVMKKIDRDVARVVPIFGDIENIALPDNLDLVISGATMQWLDDLKKFLFKLSQSIKSGGMLVFSVFTHGTMEQVRDITGIGLQYADFNKVMEDISTHYLILEEKTENKIMFFNKPYEILRHMKETGVTGLASERWNVSKVKWFCREYEKRFLEEAGLPLTYVMKMVVAQKK